MKLGTKLLLGVGILLLAMVIIIYIVPTLLIRKDVYVAADEIHQLLLKDQRQLVSSQQIWLQNILTYTKQNNNALLFMYYQEPQKERSILFTDTNSDYSVWTNLARFVGVDPTIGFLQSHSPEKNRSAAVMPHATRLYSIDHMAHMKERVSVSLLDPVKKESAYSYLAIPLPPMLQEEKEYTLFALISSEKSNKEISLIERELEQLPVQTIKQSWSESNRLAIGEAPKTLFKESWNAKIDLIQTLTPLFALALEKNGYVLDGLARLDASGKGFSILTSEAYSAQPLFDDAWYYSLHQPTPDAPPLASNATIVTVEKGNYAYIANILLSQGTYVTIGTSVSILAQQLALASNRTILLNVNDDFWMGFDGNGDKLSIKQINEFVHKDIAHQPTGSVTIEQIPYFYGLITTLENEALKFYEFHPVGGEKSIINTLIALEDKLSNRISLQLFLISVGTMILVLLFIGRIAFTVIYPISELAGATQFVMAGRYSQVVLPDMGQRKDEVAVLTRSFGNMVAGLQEREKIRGVLDKVVSKDVADEILKTQIQLGGEDRIVTMLFCDIRGFSDISSSFSPQKTIAMLNDCMTKVSRVIEGEGGVIDKYVGDEVMAIYGAPTSHPDHALRAVSTGILIIETLKNWNQQRKAAQEPIVEMGIGIHTGLVVAGNMGSEDRLNYTVLGSSVNLAQRLCEVAKPNQLLISAATLAEPNVSRSFYAKLLDHINVKGFVEPIETYEITGFKWEV